MNSLFRKLNFTKNEIKVLLFLFVVVFLGLGIKVSKEYISGENNFDFKKSELIIKRTQGNVTEMLHDSGFVSDSSVKNTDTSVDNLKNTSDTANSTGTKSKKKGKKGENLREKSININTATKEQLILLPGIGESTAEKIIMYRNEKGIFKRIEDIMKIKGIGSKKFEKMKNYITAD